jgi:hypothetical protein
VLPKPISNRRRLLSWTPVTHLLNGDTKVPVKQRYIVQIVPEIGGDAPYTLRNVKNCTTRRDHGQRRYVWLQLLQKIKLLDDTAHPSDEYRRREVEVRKHPFSH